LQKGLIGNEQNDGTGFQMRNNTNREVQFIKNDRLDEINILEVIEKGENRQLEQL